jgi:hypothetical protein
MLKDAFNVEEASFEEDDSPNDLDFHDLTARRRQTIFSAASLNETRDSN